MKILKVTGLFFLVVGLLVFVFACAEAGSSGPDYSAVSVAPIAVSDVSGSIVGAPITSQTDFESKILGPLMSGGLIPSLSMSSIVNSSLSQTATAKTMTPFVDESDSINETVNLVDLGSPFTGGTLTGTGTYDIYGEQDDAVTKMTLGIAADIQSTITDGKIALDSSGSNYVYSVSGKANVDVLADFAMEVTGADPNMVLEFDLDYGIAFSLGFVISVNGPNASDDVGAIVVMDLNLSKSNHNSYSQADYPDDPFTPALNDSIPADATLNVNVYDNLRNLVFTHSYTFADLETLIES